jgi:putative acetyltransferase
MAGPASWTLRPERGDDSRETVAIGHVVAAAFGSAAEALLVERIRASVGYVPEASLVAEADGRIVGHVMLSRFALRNDHGDGEREDGSRQILGLSPLAVAPDWHRRGVGSALVECAVNVAELAGEPLVVLEGSPVYYRRLGFEWSVPYGITIDLPSWAPREAAQIRRLSNYDPSFRGRVVYPPAFHDLAADPPPAASR